MERCMCAGKQSARPHTDNCTLTHSRTRRPRTSHPSLSSKLLQPCLQELETSPNTIVVFFFGKCEQLPGTLSPNCQWTACSVPVPIWGAHGALSRPDAEAGVRAAKWHRRAGPCRWSPRQTTHSPARPACGPGKPVPCPSGTCSTRTLSRESAAKSTAGLRMSRQCRFQNCRAGSRLWAYYPQGGSCNQTQTRAAQMAP